MPNDTPKQPLEDEETLDLLQELRARGIAVAAFSPEDVPAWADYSGVGGPDAWFDSVSKRLEDRLCSIGMDTLDTFASNDGLPMAEPDQEI